MSDFLSRVEAILSGVMNFNPKSRVEKLLMKWVGSVGNVEDLETEDKTSLVAAINEVAESGGGGGGGVSDEEVVEQLARTDIVNPVASNSGALFINNSGKIFVI